MSGERKLFFQATTDRASFTSVGPSVFTASAATAADGADIENDVVDNHGGTKKKKKKNPWLSKNIQIGSSTMKKKTLCVHVLGCLLKVQQEEHAQHELHVHYKPTL